MAIENSGPGASDKFESVPGAKRSFDNENEAGIQYWHGPRFTLSQFVESSRRPAIDQTLMDREMSGIRSEISSLCLLLFHLYRIFTFHKVYSKETSQSFNDVRISINNFCIPEF